MQHLQFNFAGAAGSWLLIAAAATLARPAIAAQPDPLLDDGPTVSCAADAAYAGGADVHGNPVAPADIGASHVPTPPEIMVPLRGGASTTGTTPGQGAYVALDGKKLDALVNPKPCR